MQIRKVPRPLVFAVVLVATAAAMIIAVPMASARQIPLDVDSTVFAHLSVHAAGSSGHSTATLPAGTVTSTNWSGYAATGGGPYTSVTTSWVQPAVNCSATPNSYAAFWAGLDGYSSDTVEQDGTLTECIGRQAEYLAWYETYPNPMYQFGGTVSPGDLLTATVTSVSPTEFTLTLSDSPASAGAKPWTATTTQTLKQAAALSSAEVIAEAPSSGYRILPLADFGIASFENPVIDSTPLGSLTGVVPIEMTTTRGVGESIPSALSSSGFSVQWQ